MPRLPAVLLPVLALCAAKWVAVDTLAARLSPGWSASAVLPILNPAMLSGLAIAGSIVALYRLRRYEHRR